MARPQQTSGPVSRTPNVNNFWNMFADVLSHTTTKAAVWENSGGSRTNSSQAATGLEIISGGEAPAPRTRPSAFLQAAQQAENSKSLGYRTLAELIRRLQAPERNGKGMQAPNRPARPERTLFPDDGAGEAQVMIHHGEYPSGPRALRSVCGVSR